jgi:heptosyltransferase-1
MPERGPPVKVNASGFSLTLRLRTPIFSTMSFESTAKALSTSNAPAEILVTRFKAIGDIVFTLPAVHALRDNFPDSRITFFTSKENEPLIRGFVDVKDIITIDRTAFHRGQVVTIVRETCSLLRSLRRKKFSLAIDFQNYGETALLTWLTRAPLRLGSLYNRGRALAYTAGIQRDYSIHPVDWNLLLLQKGGVRIDSVRNEFILPATAQSEAREVFSRLKLVANKPTVFIQPFTSAAHKDWPFANYLALANEMRNRGAQVLFSGGPNQRAALEPANREGFAVSAGPPLLVTAGLMQLSTMVIGGDTGFVHLATALKKRVFCLAASIRPEPYGHKDWKIEPPGGSNMAGLAVSTILDACNQALAK